ncbi:MAG TPA: DUF2726 domain-containing protein [Burkholderiaceae bacterium]|nr:DUF2726 domain-containing protein [Burkholderiaceae bacterium]
MSEAGLLALALAVLMALLVPLVLAMRRRAGRMRAPTRRRSLDTVIDWPPKVARLMSREERDAYLTLRNAFPEHIVLAQVPLSRFVRVPRRHSYGQWMSRVGRLCADFVVCDMTTNLLAVVELREPGEGDHRKRKRHQRLQRVLAAAEVKVVVWRQGELPTPQSARELLQPQATTTPGRAFSDGSAPGVGSAMRLQAGETMNMSEDNFSDPRPSTWFDDFDTTPKSAGTREG